MKEKEATEIAKRGVTNGELKKMMLRAYDCGYCDDQRGKCNESFSRALEFNILWSYMKNKNDDHSISWLGSKNILMAFGDYWVGWRPAKEKRTLPEIQTQDLINPYADDKDTTI